ncbi:MAG: ATP-binding protein [Candidatus Gracilibacteria bacterium]
MTTRVDCGNYPELKDLLARSPLACDEPSESPETCRCLEICGEVREECIRAAKDESARTEETLPVDPDLLEQSVLKIENFFATVANPVLLKFKEKMRDYAARINRMIDRGEEIPAAFVEEYSTVGMNGLKDLHSLLLNAANQPGENMLYRGLLRMFCHSLNSRIHYISFCSSNDLRNAKRHTAKGSFTDYYDESLPTFNSKGEELTISTWDAHSLSGTANDRFETGLAKKGRTDILLEKKLPAEGFGKEIRLPILGHQAILDEVLQELLINAERAMPNGGKITTSVTELDGRVVMSVTDTGIGISSEVLSRIFEDRFTTRPETGGTGQGLYLVRNYIRQIGGEIAVKSVAGEGSTFSIILPLAKEAGQTATKKTS